MKRTKWFWGTFFILSAVFVIASQVTNFASIGIWSILGTILLLAVIVHSIAHRFFPGIFVPLAFIYEIFQQPLELPEISVWILLAAAVLAGIGFHYLFRGSLPRRRASKERFQMISEDVDDNKPYAKVSFGASTKYLHSTALKAGQFTVSFGSLEVYLDQAQLAPEGAELSVDCSFGAIEFYVPREWLVKNNVRGSFGAANSNVRSGAAETDAPLLTLNGNVSFGSVEINYI